MTTIAYDHKKRQIAVDGRCSTSSGVIKTDFAQKWRIVNGEYWFLAGCVADYDMFIDYHSGKKELHDGLVPDAIALCVNGNGEVKWRGVQEDGVHWTQEVTHNDACGSGQSFALAAFDFGCDAKGSVEYAITRDSCSGGKVSVFDIEKFEFIE